MEPWHIILTLVGIGVGVLSGLNALLLNSLSEKLKSMDAKLDSKRDAATCDRIREACVEMRDSKEVNVCVETKELWDAFNKHSHSPGLPPDAKVTR